MSDVLDVFGTTFTGVNGVKAYDHSTGNLLPYIRPTGTKSISANGTGIDVTEYASVDVAVPSSAPSLQSKTKSYTPSETAQSETVTADSGYDGLSSVEVSVGAIPSDYVGSGVHYIDETDPNDVYIRNDGHGEYFVHVVEGYSGEFDWGLPIGTEGTPTATKGTVSNHSVSVTPSVTNSAGYISGGTHSGTAVSVSASELVSGTYTVDSAGTKDVTNYASASIPTGGATASATKGTVSNHQVSVTPKVTRTAGWVTGGSANGTAVTVSASELVSGSETKTANGTYDVTNLAELVVDVPTGGGGGVNIGTKTLSNSDASKTSIQFTGLSGEPKAFFVRCTTQLTRSSNSSYYYVADFRWNGASGNHNGNYWRMSNGTFYNDTSHYSHTYSNGTLTLSSSGTRSAAGGSFYNGTYELVYVY